MDCAGDRQLAGRRRDHRFFRARLRWQRDPRRCDDRLRRARAAAYFAQIQKTGDAWPDLTHLWLLDPRTFEFTAKPNYLNHPPLFYALLSAIGPKLEGRPSALPDYRLFDVALVAAGLAALLALGLTAPFSRAEFYAYAMPLVWIPILVQLAATVTNDDPAFFGGALATLGVWQLVATGRGLWLACALIGMVEAA
jgi:hypothetical protein